ncbi:hypothetical protein D3C76_790450 [compost metagenome]
MSRCAVVGTALQFLGIDADFFQHVDGQLGLGLVSSSTGNEGDIVATGRSAIEADVHAVGTGLDRVTLAITVDVQRLGACAPEHAVVETGEFLRGVAIFPGTDGGRQTTDGKHDGDGKRLQTKASMGHSADDSEAVVTMLDHVSRSCIQDSMAAPLFPRHLSLGGRRASRELLSS